MNAWWWGGIALYLAVGLGLVVFARAVNHDDPPPAGWCAMVFLFWPIVLAYEAVR